MVVRFASMESVLDVILIKSITPCYDQSRDS